MNGIKIYHFCSNKHAPKIFKEGITIGSIAEYMKDGIKIHDGYMWLTYNGAPEQEWESQYLVHYSRTAWRIEINIPEEEAWRLLDQNQIMELYPGSKILFDGFPDAVNWRVYKGKIPPEWIMKMERMK